MERAREGRRERTTPLPASSTGKEGRASTRAWHGRGSASRRGASLAGAPLPPLGSPRTRLLAPPAAWVRAGVRRCSWEANLAEPGFRPCTAGCKGASQPSVGLARVTRGRPAPARLTRRQRRGSWRALGRSAFSPACRQSRTAPWRGPAGAPFSSAYDLRSDVATR